MKNVYNKKIKEVKFLLNACKESNLPISIKTNELILKDLQRKKRWASKGGKLLLKKHGPKYFSRIAKLRWGKRKKK